jgi:signal transduction histidine kinase
MNSLTVPQQRLVALLGAVYVLEQLLFAHSSREFVVTLPEIAGLIACVVYAFDRPGRAAALGSVIVIGASLLYGRGYSLGFTDMLVSEMVAGCALVVLVVWRAPTANAVIGTAGLTLSCLVAMTIRDGWLSSYFDSPEWVTIPGSPDLPTLTVRFILLVTAISIGMYLRRTGDQPADSGLRQLARRQWPLAAALAVVLLIDINGPFLYDLVRFDNNPYLSPRLILLAAALVVAICAVVAPLAPVGSALTGAGVVALVSFPVLFLQYSFEAQIKVPFTLTQLAASMALIAFVIREAKPLVATLCAVAVVVANLTVIVDSESFDNVRRDYLLPFGFLLVIAIATGLYFRARDRERTQTVRVAVSGAQNAERLALARELHDVVAHHVTGIVVQAQAARLVAERSPSVAVDALEKIEHSGAEALTAMRMLVGSLRTNQPAGESTAAGQATTDLAADIRALVDQFQGPTVQLDLNLPETMPNEMGRSVLRLVQESLTNVTKHAAGATTVLVRIGAQDDGLHVSVKDDGTARRGTPVGGSGGYGLIGMRERVELLGGFFSAGPGADGGWLVKIALPLRSIK